MARTIAKDHGEKRRQILDTAASIFAQEGFDRASMNQVAAACGVSKANIYHYFPSKEALLFGLLDDYLSDLRDRICSPLDQELSKEDRLRQTVSQILKTYQGANDHHKIQMNGLQALPKDQQDILRDYQRDMINHLSKIIDDIAPETFKGDRHKLRAATMSVFGMLNWYYMWNSGRGSAARDEYAELVTNLTLHGLRGI